MTEDRYVLLGLGSARATWFRDVGRWATSAAIPVDFIRCVSAGELSARLGSGRIFSAVALDAGAIGLDRDLIDEAISAGVAVLIIDDGHRNRDWMELGATATLPTGLTRDDLMDALEHHGRTVDRVGASLRPRDEPPHLRRAGSLIAVTGGSGAGTSTVAMALAQGLADDARNAGSVLLADLALRADLAMFHDAREIVPGLQEIIEAHRSARPTPTELRSMIFDADQRGYHLLLGLRRHRDWAVLRARAVEATLENLTNSYRIVVADIEPDLEGEDEVGSVEVEERNLLARTSTRRADLVVAVGTPDLKGLHDLLRVLAELRAAGVESGRILPVLNRSGRPGRARAEFAEAFAQLVSPVDGTLASPLHLSHRRRLEQHHRDGSRLPAQLTEPITAAVNAVISSLVPSDRGAQAVEPVPVVAGSLGHFHDEDD